MTTYDHTVKLKLKYDEKNLKSTQSLKSSSSKTDEYKIPSSYETNRSRSLDNNQIKSKVVLSSQKLPKLELDSQQSQSKFNIKEEKESQNISESMNKTNMKKLHGSSFERPNLLTDNKKNTPSSLSGTSINEITNSISCIQSESGNYDYFTMLNEKSRPSSVTNTNRNEIHSPTSERKLMNYDKPLFILTNPNGSNTYINFDRSPNESLNKSRSKSANSTNIVKLPMNKTNETKKYINYNNNKFFNHNDNSQTETDSDHDFNNVNINNINRFLKKKREFNKIEPSRKNSISRLNEKLRQDLDRSNSELNFKYNKHNNFNNNERHFIRNNIKSDHYDNNRKISEFY
jgi:hypothetical protein